MIKITGIDVPNIKDELDLINQGYNNFKGWLCNIKNSNILNIYENGDIYDGACLQKEKIGNLYSTNIVLNRNKSFITCQQQTCSCANDILITKLNPDRLAKIKMIESDIEQDYVVNWKITSKCNFDCNYCPPFLHNGTKLYNERIDLGFINLYKIINKKSILLNLLGGEPTLYNKLPEKIQILKSINKNNKIFITTNGSRNLSFLAKLGKYAKISISVHLHQPNLEKLAIKITSLAKIIPELQVHIIYPTGNLEKLKDFLIPIWDEINYEVKIIKVRKLAGEYDFDYSMTDFTEDENNRIDKLNSYFEQRF